MSDFITDGIRTYDKISNELTSKIDKLELEHRECMCKLECLKEKIFEIIHIHHNFLKILDGYYKDLQFYTDSCKWYNKWLYHHHIKTTETGIRNIEREINECKIRYKAFYSESEDLCVCLAYIIQDCNICRCQLLDARKQYLHYDIKLSDYESTNFDNILKSLQDKYLINFDTVDFKD